MSAVFIIGLVLSAAIGLSLGLIGGGGSILTVPILVYFLGVDAHDAVAMSLAVVGATSLFGTYLHHRLGSVDFRTGLLFGAAGMAGALAGSPLTKMVAPQTLLLIFAALMFVVAGSMLWRRRAEATSPKREPDRRKAVAAGFAVGILTGFLGVGGGFLIVPALVFFGGLGIREAVGTSLFVIALNSAAGLAGHAAGGHPDWALTFVVLMLAVGGAVVGTRVSRRIAAHRLQKVFAMLVVGIALFLLAKNYSYAF